MPAVFPRVGRPRAVGPSVAPFLPLYTQNARLERPIQPFKLLRRYDLIQRILYDPEVTRAIVKHAQEQGVREDVAFEQARRYAREIVPSFSAFAYFGWGVRGARFLSNALYRVRLGHHDAQALENVDPEATLVFVMNHRSNMDYVLVTHLAADRSALSYAVGEWANVWPLSGLIRAMGAYFIRRKSRGGLYRRVLRTYVRMATEGGVTQAMFPEGGLSLTGGLAAPKLGLLSYILDDMDLEQRDVVFVPVALNYDRVLEDRVLIAASGKAERRFDAGLGHVGLWPEGGARDRQPPDHERRKVQFNRRPLKKRDLDEPSIIGQCLEVAGNIVAADHVEDKIGPALGSQDFDEILLAIVDGSLGAEVFAGKTLLRRTGRGEDPCPEMARQLDGGGSNPG